MKIKQLQQCRINGSPAGDVLFTLFPDGRVWCSLGGMVSPWGVLESCDPSAGRGLRLALPVCESDFISVCVDWLECRYLGGPAPVHRRAGMYCRA